MKRFLFSLVILLAFLLLSKCQLKQETKIPLSSPYELHHVIPEIIAAYRREGNREIIEVFEYHSREMETLPKIGIHIVDSWNEEFKKPILQTSLVVIGVQKINSLRQLENASISIPDPDMNTTGKNVVTLLKDENLWTDFKRSITYQPRGILSMESVDLGEEDFAILSLADAHFIKNSLLVLELPKDKYNTLYAIKMYEEKNEEQKKFIDFLSSEKSMKIFQKYGFYKVSSTNLSKSEK